MAPEPVMDKGVDNLKGEVARKISHRKGWLIPEKVTPTGKRVRVEGDCRTSASRRRPWGNSHPFATAHGVSGATRSAGPFDPVVLARAHHNDRKGGNLGRRSPPPGAPVWGGPEERARKGLELVAAVAARAPHGSLAQPSFAALEFYDGAREVGDSQGRLEGPSMDVAKVPLSN